MKKIAFYNVYNEAQYFEESLKSIRDKVDIIVVADGAYKRFPHKDHYSTDGTLDIAKKYADILLRQDKPWKSQITKKDQCLIGNPGDVYINLDGHEIWVGDLIPPFGNYLIKMKMPDGWHQFFRMFIHVPGIRYYKRNYSIFHGDKEIGTEFPVYPNGYLIHKTPDYSKELLEDRKKYFALPGFD